MIRKIIISGACLLMLLAARSSYADVDVDTLLSRLKNGKKELVNSQGEQTHISYTLKKRLHPGDYTVLDYVIRLEERRGGSGSETKIEASMTESIGDEFSRRRITYNVEDGFRGERVNGRANHGRGIEFPDEINWPQSRREIPLGGKASQVLYEHIVEEIMGGTQ
ncbi:MAG: hypothetical protein KJ879_01030 [Nanoarchaeota archaeon]|nr:hypothetical protein [Nanoarchaeota archaeon]